MNANATAPVLRVRDLAVALPPGADRPRAVQHIDFDVAAGEIVCLLGESGSGKSIIAGAIMGLLPEHVAVCEGEMLLGDTALTGLDARARRALRGAAMAMIFQEPMTALNPVMTCGAQLDELLVEHTDLDAARRRAKILAMFESVRLPEPERMYASHPHQLSGGQRQRIMIAMALILEPRLLIADEPTTALDVTIQKQIMTLLAQLRRDLNMGLILITHNLGIIRDVVDRVAVMFRGEIVETGPVDEILRNPQHAYTKALLACVPRMGAKQARLSTIDHAALGTGQ